MSAGDGRASVEANIAAVVSLLEGVVAAGVRTMPSEAGDPLGGSLLAMRGPLAVALQDIGPEYDDHPTAGAELRAARETLAKIDHGLQLLAEMGWQGSGDTHT